MPIFNFPSNPTIGQTHTVGTTTYQWNGSAWIISSKVSVFSSATVETLSINSTSNSVSVGNGGSLTVKGGAAVAKDFYIGGNLYHTGTANHSKLTLTGGVQSFSTITGDLIVSGGVGINGNLFIGGTLFSQGAPVLTTASFNNTPADGTDIDIVDVGGGFLEFNNISTLQSVTTRGATSNRQITLSNTTVSTGTNSGALVVSGGIASNNNVSARAINIQHAQFSSSVLSVSTTTPTEIDFFYFSQYRSAKYIVQVSEGGGLADRSQTSELLTVAFNTGTATVIEYATAFSVVDLGNFSALMTNVGTDTKVSLYFVPIDAVTKNLTIVKTLVKQ